MQKETSNCFTQKLVECQVELYAFVGALMPDRPSDIGDVVQNTNVAVLAHAAEYDPERPFRPWLWAFARNQVKAYFKRESRSPLVFDDEIAFAAAEKYSETYPEKNGDTTAALLKKLDHCKERLSARHRSLVQRYYFDRRSMDDIAREDHSNPHTVATTLAYVRKKLGDCVRALCRLGAGDSEEDLEEELKELGGFLGQERPWTKADGTRLRELLRGPGRMEYWLDQNRVHALLSLEAAARRRVRPVRPVAVRVLRIAATILALAVGIGLAAYYWGVLSPSPAAKPAATVPAAALPVAPAPTAAVTSSVPAAAAEPVASVGLTAAAPEQSQEVVVGSSEIKDETEEVKGATSMTNRTSAKIVAAAMAAAAMASVAQDSPVTLTASDGSGFTSFTRGEHWSDQLPPHPGTNYLVASGRFIRTPDSPNGNASTNFAGDSLTIGTLTEAGNITQKSQYGCIVTYPRLILVNGTYGAGASLWSGNSHGPGTIAGNATVLSAKDAPFLFNGSDDKWFLLNLVFSGDVGTGVKFATMSASATFTTFLYADNSAFQGSMIVDGAGMRLLATNGAALGSDFASPVADGVILRNQGNLGATTAGAVLASVNRGIAVEATGGRLTADASTPWTLKMPVTGGGTLQKVGAGTVFCSNSISIAGIDVAEGALDLAGLTAYSCTNAVTVKAGACLSVSQDFAAANPIIIHGGMINPAGIGTIGEMTLTSNMTFNGGGIVADANFVSGACDIVHITDQTKNLPWPLPIGLSTTIPAFDVSTVTNFAILTIPTSVKTVTPADFTNTTPLDANETLRLAVTVETDGNGLQTVSIVRAARTVLQQYSNGYGSSYNTANTWKNYTGNVAPGYEFLDIALTARTPGGNVTFAGNSLTLVGTAQKSPAVLLLKGDRFIVNDCRMRGNTWIQNGRDGGYPQTVGGRIFIGGGMSAPSYFGAADARVVYLDAELWGTGCVWCCSGGAKTGTPSPNIYLSAMNTNFIGRMVLDKDLYEPATNSFPGTLYISDERNLGGNPPAFLADALLMNGGKLVITNSFVIDDSNRGVTVSNATVEVGMDETLALNVPVVFNGPFTKMGAGTLALGFDCTGKSNELVVSEGNLKVTAARALDDLRVALSNDTELVIEQSPAETAMATYGIISERDDFLATASGTVPFVIDWNGATQTTTFTVPLCTVSLAQGLALDGKIVVDSAVPAGFQSLVVSETVEVGGVQMTRFSARYTSSGGTRYTFR